VAQKEVVLIRGAYKSYWLETCDMEECGQNEVSQGSAYLFISSGNYAVEKKQCKIAWGSYDESFNRTPIPGGCRLAYRVSAHQSVHQNILYIYILSTIH
jgi:hypothetical protein